ncbi:MAG: phosphoheptose isomerase [candidate division Zixibacteria bacterium SM23_73_2]|nr:MAG: phosphoheptose isomerase [candidate division Zixibacteria bacterium SM23_73_2]
MKQDKEEKKSIAKNQIEDSIKLKEKIKSDEILEKIVEISDILSDCIKNDGKILLCGNGGSAADAQHIAGELVVRLTSDSQRKGLPAMALTSNPSVVTASANDFGFESVFARQIEALGKEKDILILISTSGNSPNLLKAAETAKGLNIKTIGLLGKGGGKLTSLVAHSLLVPSDDTQRIQEVHITIGHILVSLVEKNLML